MDSAIRIAIDSDADVVTARQKARELGSKIGLTSTDLTLLATAISEIARNITAYAGSGEVQLFAISEGRRQGVKVIATDTGPGIDDVALALQDGWSSGSGLGLGLPGARRLVDVFEVESQPGLGTTVTLIKWGREE